MNVPEPASAGLPACLASPSGLRAELNANGSLRRLWCGDILINLFPGNEAEGGPANLYLRRLGAAPAATPLLGPCSPAAYCAEARGLTACGAWEGLAFRLRLTLAESAPAWFWHVEVENTGPAPAAFDLLLAQDLGLAHYGAVRLNEFYVSHYVDHAPLHHARCGVSVASRQNQAMGGRFPRVINGSLGRGVSFATDALQVYGLARRAGGMPAALAAGLAGQRLQHEHALAAVQDEPFLLEPGAKATRGFFGWFQPDCPAATAAADAALIDGILALPEAAWAPWPEGWKGARPAPSLFATAPELAAGELGEDELDTWFGGARRHAEREGGRTLSFFTDGGEHVALRAKELRVLRPHGHILRTGGALTPDESALTSTAWMGGVFHSMVTQGHVSINRFLSTCHSYLGLFRSHGQRVFVEEAGAWRLLGTPSAFAMRPDGCRWLYRHAGGVVEAEAAAPSDRHELRLSLRVLEGGPARFLVVNHLALGGDDGSAESLPVWEAEGGGAFVRAPADSDVGRRFPGGGFTVAPAGGTRVERLGGDELLFADGAPHGQPFLCLVTAPAAAAELVLRGRLVAGDGGVPAAAFWGEAGLGLRLAAPEASPLAPAAARAEEIFPWLVHNALTHYLSPRGLEQYSGGGWGTRDVCQGPVELLLSLGRFEPVRDVLRRVFRQQNPDGDWPQWFMFFERERAIRPGDSHGDIAFWPLLALSQYLRATGDAALLEEPLPFFHPEGDAAAERDSVLGHVERALALISRRVVAGTVLAAYGHGDWNDSLQPARPDLRERLCSSWTVTLHYQTFVSLAEALRRAGFAARAAVLEERAAAVREAFQRLLVADGVVAGLVYFREPSKPEHLIHPRDSVTGLRYSLLPMIHGVLSDLFTPGQAAAHLELVRAHLLGPDGAHLFDRPMAYRGGPQTFFQRAESASYFGREIGLMYTHAHLRYGEALARAGDAEGFFRALCLANPVALRELVPSAALRQANCYASSSDPAFADRYEAFAHYDRVGRGEVALEGGWRVYSSGAGIGARLVVQVFLGLRFESDGLVVDPVLPRALDGMTARLRLCGRTLEVVYRVGERGCGPVSVGLNGADLAFTRDPNPYRPGAARIARAALEGLWVPGVNRLCVAVG